MGKPAARVGDMTVHGGTIVMGCPNVLIGGMPAARLGDPHVCPLANPAPTPVPHVGMPIVMGSLGVFIGGMPAARVGDTAPCTGPPDSIAMGCFTVLMGLAGEEERQELARVREQAPGARPRVRRLRPQLPAAVDRTRIRLTGWMPSSSTRPAFPSAA